MKGLRQRVQPYKFSRMSDKFDDARGHAGIQDKTDIGPRM
jgi:hypothetical protein